MSKQFIYKTTITWKEEKKGFLRALGKETIEIATPPEFKGHEGLWTPEELFVASVNGCIETTFLHYAQRSNFEFLGYESEAEGILEKVGNKFMFSEIKVTPKIIVASSGHVEKAQEAIKRAEDNCLISNSIVSKVKVYPEIKVKS